MKTYENRVLAIIDAQVDFIDGNLAVPGGKRNIDKINKATRAYGRAALPIVTTQDWHPRDTEHFSPNPNYINTWPVHCVAGSHGAKIHPDLEIAKHEGLATRFLKGTETCTSPDDDTSYTAIYAQNSESGLSLPDWLSQRGVTMVDILGYAIGDGDQHQLCVDSSATDLHNLGYRVNVIHDVVEEVLPENRTKCLENLGAKGIRLITLAEMMQEISCEK